MSGDINIKGSAGGHVGSGNAGAVNSSRVVVLVVVAVVVLGALVFGAKLALDSKGKVSVDATQSDPPEVSE